MMFTYTLLFRCSSDSRCSAYQFSKHRTKNCYIIHGNTATGSGQNFTSQKNNGVYKKGKISSTYLVKMDLWHN